MFLDSGKFKHFLFSGSVDKRIRIWDINVESHDSASTATLEGHRATVWTIMADLNKIVSGAADNEIRIWDPETYKCLKVIRGHSKAIRCIDIGYDFIVSGSTDGVIKFWDFDPTVEEPYK
jgi:WD40 repeat protein